MKGHWTIDWYVDIWGDGWGRKRRFLGDRARLMQSLYHVYLEEFGKWLRYRLLYTAISKRVLDITRIKIGHLKGESRWESSGILDSNELDIEELKAS